MKAKEYFERFKDLDKPEKFNDEFIDSFIKIYHTINMDLLEEVQFLATKRNTKSNDSVIAIIKELNQKSNAINRLVENKYGQRIIEPDAFYRTICAWTPELGQALCNQKVITWSFFSEVQERKQNENKVSKT